MPVATPAVDNIDSCYLWTVYASLEEVHLWALSVRDEARKGFAVSSALGKLRLFRALRKDKARCRVLPYISSQEEIQ